MRLRFVVPTLAVILVGLVTFATGQDQRPEGKGRGGPPGGGGGMMFGGGGVSRLFLLRVPEIQKELDGILGQNPIAPEELKKAQTSLTLELPGEWETIASVSQSIAGLVRFRLPEDYWQTYPEKVLALKLPDIKKAADTVIHPKALVWVVIGDRAKIEKEIRGLDFDDIRLIDTDGNPLSSAKN